MEVICCVCQKTKKQNGWVKRRINLSKKLSHGYCPQCYLDFMQRVGIKVNGGYSDKKIVFGV